MSANPPLVSAIVAVKNETALLEQCLTDLLNQTLSEIEIIVVDDGSDEPTKTVLSSFAGNPRIHIITMPETVGQAAARNEAFRIASGNYIAIADADDRHHPRRFELQVDYLEIHPHIDVLGSDFTVNKGYYPWEIFYHHSEISHQLLLNNPLVHSTIMFRAELLDTGWEYKADCLAEDYEVLARNRNHWLIHNLNDKLVEYHIRPKSAETVDRIRHTAREVRNQVLQDYLPNATELEKKLHRDFCELTPGITIWDLEDWIHKLIQSRRDDPHQQAVIRRVLFRHWWLYLRKCKPDCGRKMKLKVLFFSGHSMAYVVRNAIKIVIGRPL